ncbi:MAG: IS3 family transposase [Bacteroidales bacterium]|nr:IS3 family transposase [Bacteroidales bacterium]MDE7128483.1 IS3 family transposase [Bacteroidales bacterium]
MWTGNSYDSSVTECFFCNLKTEIGNLWQFKTAQELADKTGQYIAYCNESRIQLGFGSRSAKE